MDISCRLRFALLAVVAVAWSSGGQAQEFRKPPAVVQDVLSAPSTPQLLMSPSMDTYLLMERWQYPPISELAEPMLRLAGLRINPRNNAPHRTDSNTVGRNLVYRSLRLRRVGSDRDLTVSVPVGARLSTPKWSPDGRRFAVVRMAADRSELWVADAATGATWRAHSAMNIAYMDTWGWMPDGRTLLLTTVPAGRGPAPTGPAVPVGPTEQETAGAAPVATFQDTLNNALDERLFEHYATSQLALLDLESRRTKLVGEPSIFFDARPSPDGQYLLVGRVHRPFSYQHVHIAFPRDIDIWGLDGKLVRRIASLPLANAVPILGVRTGPRVYGWKPADPAAVVWVEAMDGGDTRRQAPFRDRLVQLSAPFAGDGSEVVRTEHRFVGVQWIGASSLAFLEDNERNSRTNRTFLIDAEVPGGARRLVWQLNERELYADPGNPVMTTLPTGQRTVHQVGDFVFLASVGSSPDGDTPFLDRLNVRTLTSERLYRSSADEYEEFVALAAKDGTQYVTLRESPTSPPNYWLRHTSSAAAALTSFADPAPILRQVTKQLVTYKRADGTQLSFTLYLPPGYQQGKRLPTVVWAYPLEFNTTDTAGQVSGSTKRFSTISGASHLFFALRGFAVLDNATMPVVGDPDTANNTYVEQIVANARAAIDKAASLGVTDPDRVGVAGHSYGAFMTTNLLAHSDLFRAGIARSGAYNRTLTPFGFQSERRTLWEAPDTYLKMSPFMNAHLIKEPVLLIHGEVDNNTGTFPIQSERMYAALRGNGATARYVTLPHEPHGYIAKESVEHTVAEMLAWFEKWVKDAPPRSPSSGTAARRN